jgi:hypothetical protein
VKESVRDLAIEQSCGIQTDLKKIKWLNKGHEKRKTPVIYSRTDKLRFSQSKSSSNLENNAPI